MFRQSIGISLCLLLFSFLSSPAWASVFRIDFYTELTRTFTVDTDVFLDRTSASGSFFYDNASVVPSSAFPGGNPVIRLKNERFVNGVDSSDLMIAFDPSLAPVDWTVGLDNVGVSSSGEVVTDFLIDVFWIGNIDPAGDFNNPSFRHLVGGPGIVTRIYIPSAAPGATWESTAPTQGPSNVSWSYAVVPIPAAIWLFGSGLIGLIGLARRSKP